MVFYTIHNKETEHHDFKKLLSEVFSTAYKININEVTLLDLIYKYRKLTRGDTKLYDGVKETLENLAKDYKIFLASYTQGSYSLLEIEELGIKSFFTGFIFSSDIGYKKMSDSFYKKCIEVSNVQANECVMIGDNKLEDMYMANKNGMKTVWIKNPVTINNNPEVLIVPTSEVAIEDFSNLVNLLKTI